MNKNEYMKRRNVRSVLRYHTPNKTKEPELYFHHLLMLYFPWREETQLLSSDQTYTSKFYELDIQAVVEQNRTVFEPDVDAITEALETMRNNGGNIVHSYDSINDQENSDLSDETPNVSDLNMSPSMNSNLRILILHSQISIYLEQLLIITNHLKFLMNYGSPLDP